jgi:uncharacterized protein (UPF0297 family)
MANNIEVKKILDDIIFYTYKDNVENEVYEKLTKFYVKLENKVTNSYHGLYKYNDSSITITNLYRGHTSIICTTIHELAHHVDRVFRGKSDHSKEFYSVFEKLLYTGLNMGLFNKEDALLMQTDASDSNKVKKIIDGYKPSPINYKKDEKKIIVRNCYNIKEELKHKGFRYNSLAKTWEITVNNADVSKIEEWLKSLNSEYEIMSGNNMQIDAVGFLIATDGSYEHKEELKQNGFYWNADKKRWQKKISMQDYEKEIYTLRTLQKKVKIQLEKSKKKR